MREEDQTNGKSELTHRKRKPSSLQARIGDTIDAPERPDQKWFVYRTGHRSLERQSHERLRNERRFHASTISSTMLARETVISQSG